MRPLLLLLALVPSLASAQYTAAQKNGLVKSAIDAAAWLRVQGNTPTVVGGTQLRFGGTVPAGTPCMRCSIYLEDEDITALGLSPQNPLFTQGGGRYAVMQICGPAVATPTYNAPAWLRDLVETCNTTPFTAPSTYPKAVIAHRTDSTAQAVATGFACACSTGTNCTWQAPKLPDGTTPAPGPAPLGVTLAPGSWSGAGCSLKTCVEKAGFSSWPDSCPLK